MLAIEKVDKKVDGKDETMAVVKVGKMDIWKVERSAGEKVVKKD